MNERLNPGADTRGSPFRFAPFLACGFAALFALTSAGCQKSEQITRYTVERAPVQEVAAKPQATGGPLSFETPEGWEQGKAGGMRKAAFEVRDKEQKVEITVIDLAASAGDLLPNVNRWRGQIQLPDVTADELAKQLKKVDVGGQAGDYIELIGPEQEGKKQTILGVILRDADRSWFFKLQGDAALAEREKPRFEAFVQSIKFRGAEGAGNGQ